MDVKYLMDQFGFKYTIGTIVHLRTDKKKTPKMILSRHVQEQGEVIQTYYELSDDGDLQTYRLECELEVMAKSAPTLSRIK